MGSNKAHTSHSMISLIGRLWHHLNPRRRRQFGLLLLLIILASFAEVVSIGAVLPFLAAFTAPDKVFFHPAMQPFVHFMGIASADQLLLPITVAIGLSALLSGLLRMLLIWLSARLSCVAGADISIDIYRRTLYQPYALHVSRNSSNIINGITKQADKIIHGVIGGCLQLISSGFFLLATLGALLYVAPLMSLMAFAGFGSIYGFVTWATRSHKIQNSQLIARKSSLLIKCIQEGLGGIRDVLIDGSQSVYCDAYRAADVPLRRAQASEQFIVQAPRYAVEALGIVLIVVLAYVLAQQADGVAKAIPILGALALGAQRMLPAMQQVYGAWATILGCRISLQDTLELLDQPEPTCSELNGSHPIPFRNEISIKQLAFRYSAETPWVLENIVLNISKGSRVGFVGPTGSGKSTLIDVVMGLLQPSSGLMEVDGQRISIENQRAWQAHIAHVPQSIFLADCSIEENIAFGVPIDKIDHERVRHAARQALISETIALFPRGYKTHIGERGVRLSGGQRQRIGIARALYKQADVIILDEATSALDNETERSVMQSIEKLGDDLTILVIAHRLSTLKNCDMVVELNDGRISRVGTYEEIVSPKE